jgi:predicted component of type VI protein secretion system
MAKLIFISSDFAGRTYELVLEKTTIGRGEKNTLVVRDGSVSASHCEILVFGPEVIVRDLGSANGTFVDGARLQGQTQVKSGQLLRFGNVEARLELAPLRDNSDDSEMTAIHVHAKMMREHRKARSTTPLMKLEHAEHAASEEQTVLTPRRPAPASIPAPAAVEPPESSSAKSSTTKILAITAIVIVGVILLVWLLLQTK